MANRIDTGVQLVKPTNPKSVANRPPTQPQPLELTPPHHPVLPPR